MIAIMLEEKKKTGIYEDMEKLKSYALLEGRSDVKKFGCYSKC